MKSSSMFDKNKNKNKNNNHYFYANYDKGNHTSGTNRHSINTFLDMFLWY